MSTKDLQSVIGNSSFVIRFTVLHLYCLIARYQLSVIKGQGESQINANFLITVEQQNEVRDFLEALKIVVVSLSSYTGEPGGFGDVALSIQLPSGSTSEWITNMSDPQQCATTYTWLGIPIVGARSLSGSRDPTTGFTHMKTIISQIQTQIKAQQAQLLQLEQERQKMFQDPRYQKLQEMIAQTISDVEELQQKTNGTVSPISLRDLSNQLEELKKLRMGTNIDKITDALEMIFTAMERIDLEYLETQKEHEVAIMKDSLISDTDVIGELDKYNKAQKVHLAGTSKNAEDHYYVFFGKLGIYQKFLTKELLGRLQKLTDILYNIFDYIGIFVIMILLIASVYIALYPLIIPGGYVSSIYEMMMTWGVFGLSTSLVGLLRMRQSIVLLSLLGVLIFLHFYLFNLMVIHIAL